MTPTAIETSYPRFSEQVDLLALRTVLHEVPGIRPAQELAAPDWQRALLFASSLTADTSEAAQDVVLRVAQACLLDPTTTAIQKRAALLLLERMGNQLAAELAIARLGLAEIAARSITTPLDLEAQWRGMELAVRTRASGTQHFNDFQRAFWRAVQSNDWVSISAPTSAGKSHVVRTWLIEQFAGENDVRAVYVAPTRALVEEVAREFLATLDPRVPIVTMPWDPKVQHSESTMFVVTQERLHLIFERNRNLAPDIIFVDEAQKIGEGTRGILLTNVIDEAVRRSPDTKVVFASPLTQNPGLLTRGAPQGASSTAIVSETVTVNQNLIFANQVPRQPARYALSLVLRGSPTALGEVSLPSAPLVSQRVPALAAALGKDAGGNLVYANGPGEAENFAEQLYEALGPEADTDTPALVELVDYAKGTVHEKFVLARYVTRGVGFHYGDMPLGLKEKVEACFRDGHLRFLVCTSTLLEGVNLPCRSIFIRNPKKGSRTKMTLPDFWNLAGRAGRWGKEFQGNIFCIDTSDTKLWPEPPSRRQRAPIRRAADTELQEVDRLFAYIDGGAQKASDDFPSTVEALYGLLAANVVMGRPISEIHGLDFDAAPVELLQSKLEQSLEPVKVPLSLIRKHSEISPRSMQRLVDYAVSVPDVSSLALVLPQSDDAAVDYEKAFGVIYEYLGGPFAYPRRRLQLAGLVVNWLRGLPLNVIIENRASYRRQQRVKFNYRTLIRETMSDVEQIARFQAPKYLAAYTDLVRHAAATLGVHLETGPEDLSLLLELGVPRRTEASLMSLGLSRSTTMALSRVIFDDSMTPERALTWLRDLDLDQMSLPAFAQREVAESLELLRLRIPGAAD